MRRSSPRRRRDDTRPRRPDEERPATHEGRRGDNHADGLLGVDAQPACGVVRFDVVNAGRTDANEFEVREGSVAIGELEKLEPGEGKSFTLRLHGGTYGTAA